MERRLPLQLLNLFVLWFTASVTCVKWGAHSSHFFRLMAGIRQGGVLSPYFFAVFVDILVSKIQSKNIGCYIYGLCAAIFLYADDIILLAPSIGGLQQLMQLCEAAVEEIDMKINVSKTVCIRFGNRCNAECVSIKLNNGDQLQWVDSCRYLGIYFAKGRTLSCLFSNAKKNFYKSFNSVYSKIGRFASEEVVLNLLNVKCMSSLLYGTEACPMFSRHKHSFDFVVTRVFMKILCTRSATVVEECQRYFCFLPSRYRIDIRTARFLDRFGKTANIICRSFYVEARKQLRDILLKYGVTDVTKSCMLANIIHKGFVNGELK